MPFPIHDENSARHELYIGKPVIKWWKVDESTGALGQVNAMQIKEVNWIDHVDPMWVAIGLAFVLSLFGTGRLLFGFTQIEIQLPKGWVPGGLFKRVLAAAIDLVPCIVLCMLIFGVTNPSEFFRKALALPGSGD